MKKTVNLKNPAIENHAGITLPAAQGPGGGSGHGGGAGGGSGGGPGGGQGGGKGGGGGGTKGDLYGDQYILLRDLDPAGGGGNGEPVLDANGQPILIGTNGEPIYFVQTVDGDYEIPPELVAYTQTVELERANVARAPSKVMEKSLTEALNKVNGAVSISTDAAGRLVCDGATIDSPLENLALYQYLMKAGGHLSWPEAVDHWPEVLRDLVGDSLNPAWSPSSLLGAAFSKETPITLDAVVYENTVLGVNQVGTNGAVNYYDFSTGGLETFNYDRLAHFDGVWLQWYADTDGDPTDLELVQKPLLEAVFENQAWVDSYLQVGADPSTFTPFSAVHSGLNDFAQAVDDARAVINFMHETGAIRIEAPTSPPLAPALTVQGPTPTVAAEASGTDGHTDDSQLIVGTHQADNLQTQGGPQTILSGNGGDVVSAEGGPDTIDAGNAKDTLYGGSGPDELLGGNGKDTLVGGAGPDQLTGGRGADTFVYLKASDAPAHGMGGHGGDAVVALSHDDEGNGPRQETITDFQTAIDRIDFSQLGPMLHYAEAPEAWAVWATATDGGTMVCVDLDGQLTGEHPAEMMIVLTGVQPFELSAMNFAL